jgi:hypothetical protein
MKIRNGFVSNSSSSSFVAKVISESGCAKCGANFYELLIDMISNSNNCDTKMDDIDDYLSSLKYEAELCIGSDSDEEDIEIAYTYMLKHNRISDEIKNGAKLHCFNISYHDDAVTKMYELAKAHGNIEELDSSD